MQQLTCQIIVLTRLDQFKFKAELSLVEFKISLHAAMMQVTKSEKTICEHFLCVFEGRFYLQNNFHSLGSDVALTFHEQL